MTKAQTAKSNTSKRKATSKKGTKMSTTKKPVAKKKATVKSTPKKKAAAKKPVAKKKVNITARMVLTADQKITLIEEFTADKKAELKFKKAYAQLVESKKEFAAFPKANLAAYYYAANTRIKVKKVKGTKTLVS